MINSTLIQETYSITFQGSDLVGLGLFYLLVRWIYSKNKISLLIAVVLSGLAQVIYGELQLYGVYHSLHSGFSVTGSFFNPGPYAGYLAVIFPVALGLYFYTDKEGHGAVGLKKEGIPLDDGMASLSSVGLAMTYNTKVRSWVKGVVKYLSLATVLGILLVLPVANSRAAWLAVMLSGGFLAYHRYSWKRNSSTFLGIGVPRQRRRDNSLFRIVDGKIKRGLAAVLLLVVMGLVLFGVYLVKKDSADGRLLIWKASWKMIMENPWLGIGFDRFKAGYMEAQADYFREHPDDLAIPLADDVVYAFNEGVQLLVEQGLVGFVLVVGLLVVAFRSPPIPLKGEMQPSGLIRCKAEEKGNGSFNLFTSLEARIAQAGLVSLLVFGMFSYPSHILPIKICGVIYLAILAGNSKKVFKIPFSLSRVSAPGPQEMRSSTQVIEESGASCLKRPARCSAGQRLRWWTVSGASMILAVAIIWHASRVYQATQNWKDALNFYERGAYSISLEHYEKAFPIFAREGEFLCNYGKALSVSGKHVKAVVILEEASNYLSNTIIQTALGDSYKALEDFDKAEQAYQLGADMLPDRFYPKYLLANLYHTMGEEKKMKSLAHYLVEKDPKVPSQAVREIKEEMRRLLGE
ncbi:O-antigen ligase family protein [Echinicola salinicaeni]|uniref:O-antigen ligase family protein n=1 Tax=Echinicola salinicaeni TaxID=2762757 RepID=UPI001646DEFC|nr:O-antigen ligase family protein [Echinicola salinicaeni]